MQVTVAQVLTVPVVNATTVITLRTGLAAAEGGNVTVNILLCRATGHDFRYWYWWI